MTYSLGSGQWAVEFPYYCSQITIVIKANRKVPVATCTGGHRDDHLFM